MSWRPASRDAARAADFAADYGIGRSYGSYEDLAADDSLDVIYVATLHPGHHGAARLCLLAGRAVLVEKPFTVTAAEAEDLVALARERHLFAMEAMWTRFSPLVRAPRAWCGTGRSAGSPRSRPTTRAPRRTTWAAACGTLTWPGVPCSISGCTRYRSARCCSASPTRSRRLATPAPNGVDANTAVIARYGGAVGLYHFGLLGRLAAGRRDHWDRWHDHGRAAVSPPPGAPHPAARGPGAGNPCDHPAGARLHLRGRRGRPLPARLRGAPNPRCSRWTTRWP